MKDNLVITIERQYGSGGRIVGKMLAEELGIHFYDEEILKLTSEESAIGEKYFRLADEKAGNNLLYKIVSGLKPQLTKPSLDDNLISPDNLFLFQSQVIKKLALEESCIIAGRCADYILGREIPDRLIRVFVYADQETNIKRVVEVDEVDAKEAEKRVKKINKDRKEYHKYYTGTDWYDWENYDMTINTSRMDLKQAGQLIKEYIKIRGYIK